MLPTPRLAFLRPLYSASARSILKTSASAHAWPVLPRRTFAVVSSFEKTTTAQAATAKEEDDCSLPHPVYTAHVLRKVHEERDLHYEPDCWQDRIAFQTVKTLRRMSDWFLTDAPDATKFLNRFVYLETVAAVPGMVAGMLRHLRSLRRMDRDHGWIHTLWSEADNERMHLLTWLHYRKPGLLMRSAVLAGQGAFFNAFFLAYIISPTICHRFVGYLEEEAVHTYTAFLEAYDRGELPEVVRLPAPEVAIKYWKLPQDATIRDVAEVIRADEAVHRDVNHTFGDYHKQGEADHPNPFM